MWLHLLSFHQVHHQEEFNNSLAISKSHYGSYNKNKAEVFEWSYHGDKGLSN